jgi:hypothetical protein
VGIKKGIRRAIAFEFQTELQRIRGINYTVDIKEMEDPRMGFYVRILKDDRPIETIPIVSNKGMRVGSPSKPPLKEEDAINGILRDIVERYSSGDSSS